MLITRETVVQKLTAYLHYESSLGDLVGWAQLAMMEGELDDAHHDAIRDSVARLGIADARAVWIDVGGL
jgi:hypothetical protein